MFHAAIASLLLCNPLYSQGMPVEEEGLNENGMAMKLMRNTLASNPNSKIAKITCAKVLLKNGNRKEAEELLLQVLEMDPTNKSANKILRELNSNNPVEAPVSFAPAQMQVTPEPDNFAEIQPEDTIQTQPVGIPQIKEETVQARTSTPPMKPVVEPVSAPAPIEQANIVEQAPVENQPVQLATVTEPEPPVQDQNPTLAPAPIIPDGAPAPASALTLPSKEEILRRAKEKAVKNYAQKKAEKEGLAADVEAERMASAQKKTQAQPEIVDLIEPITLEEAPALVHQEPYYSAEEKKNSDNEVIASNVTPAAVPSVSSDGTMVFTPYIAGQRRNQPPEITSVAESQTLPKPIEIDTRKQLSNTAVKNFLKATTQSFSVNLDEALCKVENNELVEADNYLNKAAILAVASKDTKKVYDVQLSRAVIYIYQGNFDKYGKHIMGLRKGVSDDVYNSLNEMYKVGSSLPDDTARIKFAAKVALDSGHYKVAEDLASKVQPQDSDTQTMIQIARENLSKISGESLLNKGSYMGALEYFEKDNDDAEAGRTYLAISKSLDEIGDYAEAKIAEAFGKSCIMNCINNDPNNPKANLYLALYFLDQGNKDQAKEAIRRGLNSQSDNELVTSKLLNLSENL